VLQPLDTIECRDAVLRTDGKVAEWPPADVIVGNPPFLGDKAMMGVMGTDAVDKLRHAYAGRVPGGADLVCFWFEMARCAIENGAASRAGLVATNSIRGGANRRVLDAIAQSLLIFEAWSDEPWTVEGAAVRVSLVCFAKNAPFSPRFDGHLVDAILPDLTSGLSDLTEARALSENVSVAFNGIQKTGPFELNGEVARHMLLAPLNPNGRPNSDVLKPWWNGLDVARRNRDMWIVDCGLDQNESHVAFYALPFAWLAQHVKPTRIGKREERTNRCWRLFQWPRPVMRAALSGLGRFIVTPEVSKHRISTWASGTPARGGGVLYQRYQLHQMYLLPLPLWEGAGGRGEARHLHRRRLRPVRIRQRRS
jgi:hypothetical protein